MRWVAAEVLERQHGDAVACRVRRTGLEQRPGTGASNRGGGSRTARDHGAAVDVGAGQGRRRRSALSTDVPAHCCKYRLITQIGRVAVPSAQRCCLTLAESERRLDRIDQDRNIDAPTLRAGSLRSNELPFGADRALAPDDKDAASTVELLLDCLAPRVPSADMLVPPDGEAIRLQRLHQRLDATPVFRFVGDEDVGHFRRGSSFC